MQIKENDANKKYNILLRNWAYDVEYIDDINANFPSFFGGAYINNDKDLVIQVTKLNEDTKNYFSKMISLSNVKFEETKYSFDELKKEQEFIVSKMELDSKDILVVASVSGVGISIPENSVTIYVYTTEKGLNATQYAEDVKNNISSFDNIKTIIVDEKDTVTASVEPGTEIKNGGARSVGFWAYDNNNNLGLITAPHSTISKGTTMKIGTRDFGIADTPYFSGNTDAVFIKRTNSYFTPSRFVSGWDFNLASSSYIVLAVGSTTYSKGKTSGNQMGTIQDINYTTTYGITNCVVTSAVCNPGDSGGVVAGGGSSSLRNVAGIITGRQGGTSYIMYIKAGNILSKLNVSIY